MLVRVLGAGDMRGNRTDWRPGFQVVSILAGETDHKPFKDCRE